MAAATTTPVIIPTIPSWADSKTRSAGIAAFANYLNALLKTYRAVGSFKLPEEQAKADRATANIDKITSQQVVENDWLRAFTHSSVADIKGNFEKMEIIGDKVLGDAFTDIMEQRFDEEFTEELGTDLDNLPTSALTSSSQLTVRMGLKDYLFYDVRINFTKKMDGDIFEMFAGALKKIANKYIARGVGNVMVENILITIFADEKIDVAKLKANPVARLNNIITANNLDRGVHQQQWF